MLGTHTKQPRHWYLAKQCSRNFAACCGLTLPDTVIQKFQSELSNRLDLALEMRFMQFRWLQHDSPTGSHNVILCLLYWSSCPPSCFHRYPKEIRSVVPVLRCLEHRPGERPAWHVNLSRLCRCFLPLSLCSKSPSLSEGHKKLAESSLSSGEVIIGDARKCQAVLSWKLITAESAHHGMMTSQRET